MRKLIQALLSSLFVLTTPLFAQDAPSGRFDAILDLVQKNYIQRPSGKTIDKHDASASKDNAGIAPDPGMEIALEEKELEAWRTEMDRLDGPFLLTAGEQTAAPDRVLERALEVLSGAMAHARKEEAAKPD